MDNEALNSPATCLGTPPPLDQIAKPERAGVQREPEEDWGKWKN
jgi:hypothetical protein